MIKNQKLVTQAIASSSVHTLVESLRLTDEEKGQTIVFSLSRALNTRRTEELTTQKTLDFHLVRTAYNSIRSCVLA